MLRGTITRTGVIRTTNPPPATSYTMMVWVYPVSFNANDNVFLCRGNDTGGKKVLYTADPEGILDFWSGDGVTTGSTLSLLTWVHLAVTYDGNNALVYRDGVLDITAPSTTAPVSATVAVGQEVETGTAGSIDGRYGGILIYNRVLTRQEIRRQTKQIAPISTAGLNTFSPHRNLAEAAINYAGAHDLWTVTGTHTVEPGPPIPWVLHAPRRVYRRAGVAGDEGALWYLNTEHAWG